MWLLCRIGRGEGGVNQNGLLGYGLRATGYGATDYGLRATEAWSPKPVAYCNVKLAVTLNVTSAGMPSTFVG